MNKRWKFLLVGLAILGSMGYLITTSIQATGMRYTKVEQLGEADLGQYDNHVKVTGKVVEGSIDYDPGAADLVVSMTDETDAEVKVEYDGVKPDALHDGGGLIVEGYYDPDRHVVEAYTLLAKCPSRYDSKIDPSETSKESPYKPSN